MPTGEECIFCCEIGSMQLKKKESELKVACITEHEGFTAVCLFEGNSIISISAALLECVPIPVYQ